MYTPAADDEITGLVRYLDAQLDAIRCAVIGLTDEQARMRPCRSELSIGGLLKHVAHGMRGAVARLSSPEASAPVLDDEAIATYMGAFVLRDDETAADVLAEFDAARAPYVAAIAATDPGAATVEPPAPWYGVFDARPANARYYLVHQIEELARHAGHADILREQIDGVTVPTIVMTEAGAPANQFFQPYVPAAGTIGAR